MNAHGMRKCSASISRRWNAATSDRLIVMMPPRHGKTMHVSQALPAWTLGRDPKAQIILASYGADLAERNSRKARSFMRSDRWPFECKVSEESRAQNRWKPCSAYARAYAHLKVASPIWPSFGYLISSHQSVRTTDTPNTCIAPNTPAPANP